MKFLSDRTVERLRAGASAPELAGTQYRLLERIARGGMGAVYAAEDMRLERRVALKILDLPDADGEFSERLIREARVLARLEHPGIVPVHDVGTLPDGRVFCAMKFVEGRRLDEHIADISSLPDRLRLFLRICDTVAFAHARGVLHRDLKPSNVMVGPFGEVLVMDWGLAKVLREKGVTPPEPAAGDDSAATGVDFSGASSAEDVSAQTIAQTDHGVVLGTPGYMSPEQAQGEIGRIDERSDIYALGAILSFLVSSKKPTEAAPGGNAAARPLAAICRKATAEVPAERYAKVQELAEDVSRYLDGLAVSAYQETVAEKLGRFYQRHRVAILLISAYLVMRVVLVFLTRR